RRFHRAAQEQIAGQRGNAFAAEQVRARHRQRPLAGNPPDIAGDGRALEDEAHGLRVHAERERLAEMRGGLGAIAQRLVRIAGIVVTRGVHVIGSNRFRERLHRGAVIAGRLRHQAEKVQALRMAGLARENVPADLLRLVEAAHSVEPAGLRGEVGNADARGAEGRYVLAGRVPSLTGRAPFFSVHDPSTGPSCKTRRDIGPNAIAAKDYSARDPHRQVLDAADEAGIDPLRLADHLDAVETLQHLLPHDLELQFGEPHADAAVDAEAERQMDPRPGAV
ncbi:hypothetical protein chiPu_0029673, partial [Chiloscyllium punctatum]|nr:hypothetical protein [Chiloscyllium punctatum]